MLRLVLHICVCLWFCYFCFIRLSLVVGVFVPPFSLFVSFFLFFFKVNNDHRHSKKPNARSFAHSYYVFMLFLSSFYAEFVQCFCITKPERCKYFGFITFLPMPSVCIVCVILFKSMIFSVASTLSQQCIIVSEFLCVSVAASCFALRHIFLLSSHCQNSYMLAQT